jgi:hypothetical protein
VILKKRRPLNHWLKLWSPLLFLKSIAIGGLALLFGFTGHIFYQNGYIPGIDNFEKGGRWLENRWKYRQAKPFLFSPLKTVLGSNSTSLAYYGFKKISEKEGIKIHLETKFHIDQNTDLEQAAKLFALFDVLDLWPQVLPHIGWRVRKGELLEAGNLEDGNNDPHDIFSRLLQIIGPYYENRFWFIFADYLSNDFVRGLLVNKEFMRIYIQSLDLYSRNDFLQAIFNPENDKFIGFLGYKVKLDPFVNIDEELLKLYVFSEHLRKRFLYPVTHLYSFLNEFSNQIMLEILVRHPLPVEILYLEFNGKRLDLVETPVFLRGKPYQGTMESKTVMFHGLKGLKELTDNPNLILHYRLPGIDFEFVEKVRPFAYKINNKSEFILSRISPADLSRFNGIHVEENKKIIFLRKNLRIDQNLKIPEGYIVKAEPGTRIELTNFASFISYSPLEFLGSPDNPIVVSAVAGGQGFAVLDVEKKSILENVVFENLSEPRIGSWNLTGAVTFYESSTEMRNVKILNSKAEDGLNIVRGSFLLDGCIFINSQSDALDVDFGNGKIIETQFLESGNDAVDLSGSRVQIENIFVSKAKDKGISLGEKSKVYGERVIIRDTVVGIASKDLSQGDFNGVTIEKAKIGLAAYQKKGIFGPGSLHVKKFARTELEKDWLIEERSTLKIDGNEINGKERQLAKLLY